jgi:uncharacterized protein YjbI with pentapeptide repeats
VVLRGARMNSARFSGCDLTRLDASRAEMTGVMFRNCCARDIVLIGADLAECEIAVTDVRGAVMTGASLRGASISNLTRAAPLERVRLREASSALDYARFGYHATRGSVQGASWISSLDHVPWKHPSGESVTLFRARHAHLVGSERVHPRRDGWIIEAWAARCGALVRNTITVGYDGAFVIEESIVEQDLPALREADE